jgi:hypothetical protein
MDKLEFAEGLGKKIIENQHSYFTTEGSEDLEHIPNLKRIIMAISEYLESDGLPKDGIIAVADNLIHLSKSLFIDSCLTNKDEEEGDLEVREESESWFDYIYEHEEYPE